MNTAKIYSKLIVLFVPLLLSGAVWLSPTFLDPNAYYNLGDTAFALIPEQMLRYAYSAWVEQGLGRPNLFSGFIPVYFIVYILRVFFIPLWVVNRLWLIIPTAMVGWSTYYLFTAFMRGKYKEFCGLIAAMFAMLPPMYSVIPVWYIALSGLGLVLGSVIRVVEQKKYNLAMSLLIAFGVAVLTLNPRICYLTMVAVICYFINCFVLNRRIFTRQTALFIIKTIFVTIIVNAYWIAPFLYYYLMKNPALAESLASDYGKALHRDMMMQYTALANPLWVFRRMLGGNFAGFDYMKQPIIYQLSFLMPIYIFAGLFFKSLRKNKTFLNIIGITLVFLFFSIALHYRLGVSLYLFFWEKIPGFCILNNPGFWVDVLGVLFAVLTGATTMALFCAIDSSRLDLFGRIRKDFLKKAIGVFLCILIFVVYGGPLLIGINPKRTIWGRHIYLNHTRAAKVPEEYFNLREYLQENAVAGNRVLNLPWTIGGYAAYTWWHEFTMPEIFEQISPIPVVGTGNILSKQVKQVIAYLHKSDEKAFDLLKNIGVRYVLLHKDYYPLEVVFRFDEPSIFINFFVKHDSILPVIDNEHFTLYELQLESKPVIYLRKEVSKSEEKDYEKVNFVKVSETKYKVGPLTQDSVRLVFNQAYHPLWRCVVGGDRVVGLHEKTELGMNVWDISFAREKKVTIEFMPHKWVKVGVVVSILSLLGIISIVFWENKLKWES